MFTNVVRDKNSYLAYLKNFKVTIHTHLQTYVFLYICVFPEKSMATHSSTLAWTIPWTEEPGGLQSLESQRVRHD